MSIINFAGNIENIDLSKLPENNEGEIIERYKEQLYKTFLNDLNFSFKKHKDKVLFLLPLSHSKKFIKEILAKRQDKNSVIYNSNIEIAILDKEKIKDSNCVKDFPEQIKQLLEKIKKADKYVEIYDTGRELETFALNKEDKKIIQESIKFYLSSLSDIIAKNPKLKTYFPSEEQAHLEGMTLEEFYKLYFSACNLDWKYMYEANEELVKLFIDYDYIKITGENANITYGIKGMKAKNSVIDANYPGCEVFSAPVVNSVNGWIYYPNKTYFKYTGDLVEGLYFEFKDGKLINFDIKSDVPNKQEILNRFLEKFDEHPQNRFLGEIAFGTNPNIPVGTKHKLIGEKAFGMHMALGKAYKYEGVNNGNNEATIHWDAIRTLKDGVKVYFGKENGDEILIIDNGKYNHTYCPKLAKLSS